MLKEKFHVAVPTSFNQDESLNIERTIQHVKYLNQHGVKSVLVSGSTGEQHSLSNDEKFELIRAFEIDTELPEDFELIFGVSDIRQKAAEELAVFIHKSSKVKAVLVGFSPYLLPTQAEALSYFKKIVSLVDKPVIIYNNPNRTGFDLTVESIVDLLGDSRVIGIKEAGDPKKIAAILNKVEKNLAIYAGGENDLEYKVSVGYNRLSSIWGNVYPEALDQWFSDILSFKAHTLPINVSATMKQAEGKSLLPLLKQAISETEKVSIGICRSPLGN
ncbi:MAG: dihydrodipicolinate synthase family protein [Enterococcus sp.]